MYILLLLFLMCLNLCCLLFGCSVPVYLLQIIASLFTDSFIFTQQLLLMTSELIIHILKEARCNKNTTSQPSIPAASLRLCNRITHFPHYISRNVQLCQNRPDSKTTLTYEETTKQHAPLILLLMYHVSHLNMIDSYQEPH